jgi:hypothetical protein
MASKNETALLHKIVQIIRTTQGCSPGATVEALLTIAAGQAVAHETHLNCEDFRDAAHAAFHGALDHKQRRGRSTIPAEPRRAN